MEEELILFETAMLAKEKGFDANCLNTGLEDTKHIYGSILDNHNQYGGYVSIPTQSLLQKWLRDEKKLFIAIYPQGNAYLSKDFTGDWCFSLVRDLTKSSQDQQWKFAEFRAKYMERKFSSYELALEAGLLEALTTLNS